jgi:hypothetical protein
MSEATTTTTTTEPAKRFMFPRWANYALPAIVAAVIGGSIYVPVAIALGFSPATTAVGYAPEQPVPYSHALHAGKLGLDCRYCHSTVERAAFAAIPPTQVCMNCHTAIHSGSARLLPVRESWATGKPVNWVKIHDLPDYAYFNHAAHVNHGVGCVSCHGRIDHMDVVQQVMPLSMSWCLDCHRNPEKNLRPKEQVTNMAWRPTDHPLAKAKNLDPDKPGDLAKAQELVGNHYKTEYDIHKPDYMTSCFTCHR